MMSSWKKEDAFWISAPSPCCAAISSEATSVGRRRSHLHGVQPPSARRDEKKPQARREPERKQARARGRK